MEIEKSGWFFFFFFFGFFLGQVELVFPPHPPCPIPPNSDMRLNERRERKGEKGVGMSQCGETNQPS